GQEIPLRRLYKLRPDGPLMMHTPRKRVRTPVALPSTIEAAISDEINAPPLTFTTTTTLPSSLPSDVLPPHKRIQMTSQQTEATDESSTETCEETTKETPTKTTALTQLYKKSHAHICTFLILTFRI
ncbi:hypothetical protein Tco_0219318, partial [Tanacetum coccineum]